jgi:hypothetical protein
VIRSIAKVYKVPSLNCGHYLVNTNRFGVYIAHFVVVDGTRFSVLWCGACFGAGVRLIANGATMTDWQYVGQWTGYYNNGPVTDVAFIRESYFLYFSLYY